MYLYKVGIKKSTSAILLKKSNITPLNFRVLAVKNFKKTRTCKLLNKCRKPISTFNPCYRLLLQNNHALLIKKKSWNYCITDLLSARNSSRYILMRTSPLQSILTVPSGPSRQISATVKAYITTNYMSGYQYKSRTLFRE